MSRTRTVLGWLAAAVALLLIGIMVPAYAATPSATDCRKQAGISASASPGSVSSGQTFKYTECRLDIIEGLVRAGQPTAPPTSSPSPSATPTQTPTATPTPSSNPTPTVTPSSGPTTVPAGAVCKPGSEAIGYDGKPLVFTGQGSTGLGPLYNASAEQWNTNGYNFAQTMGICSHDSWYADIKTDNAKGDGAVKAYPSMRAIYWDYSVSGGNLPRLSSFPQLKVDYAGVNPASCSGCIYDTAHDIWLNGIGINPGTTELMIWTKNAGQRPYGEKIKTGIQIGGHTYDLWYGTGNGAQIASYVVTDTPDAASGTVDVKAFVANLSSLGKIEADPKVGQLSYGVEPVSTGGVSKHWDFTRFSVTSG